MKAVDAEYMTLDELRSLGAAQPIDGFLTDLRQQLLSGKLRALGRKNGLGDPIEVPSYVWRSHILSLELGGCAVDEARGEGAIGAAWARRIGGSNVRPFGPDSQPVAWLDLLFPRESKQGRIFGEAPKPCRPIGSGSLSSFDKPLLDEMQTLLTEMRVSSVTKAAKKVVERAAGDGTPESKTRRLVDAFKRRPNNGA